MSVAGVQTCGDLVFSGHTVVITLLSMTVMEYTPGSWQWLHGLCWVLNSFGVFLILAAHEHYTLDCLLALYLTSRLFANVRGCWMHVFTIVCFCLCPCPCLRLCLCVCAPVFVMSDV